MEGKMVTLSAEQIKEIAEQLEIGFSCFLNKTNNELVFIAGNEDNYADFDEDDAWADERKKIDANPDDYYEIEKMDSRDSFSVMEDFVYTIDSDELRKELIRALNNKKPFRQFKYVIDDSGEYRQKWFDFRSKKMQEWVVSEIEVINMKEENL
jgi:uncharacterized protein UPF0158